MAPRLVVETGQWKACLDTPRGERQSARQLKGEMGMNDLVKRLRDWANNSVGCNPANAPCGEAADEIERLRAALDILQAAMIAKKPIPMQLKIAINQARAALSPSAQASEPPRRWERGARVRPEAALEDVPK